MYDPCSSSHQSETLESITKILRDRFYDGSVPMPAVKFGVVRKKNHVRFSPSVVKSVEYVADEIAIDGSIAKDIYKVCACILDGLVRSYAYHHNVKISSRGYSQDDDYNGYYCNKEYKKIAESHGLITKKSAAYGYISAGVAPTVADMIDDGRWTIIADREFYTYGPKCTTREHHIKYICPVCRASMWGTKSWPWKCGKCDELCITA